MLAAQGANPSAEIRAGELSLRARASRTRFCGEAGMPTHVIKVIERERLEDCFA